MGSARVCRTGLQLLTSSCVVLALLSVTTVIATSPAEGSALHSSGRLLDVVGGPIAAGPLAVVVSVDKKHVLHLDGVDPVNDTVLWQQPYSASAITPGVALTPAADGTTVADVVPAGNPTIPAVTIDGINATTGTVEWHLPGTFILSDNPASCVAGQDFCVAAYTADGSSQLAVIDAATGHPAAVLEGPSRALGTDLYCRRQAP
jgi:hypothetical protein